MALDEELISRNNQHNKEGGDSGEGSSSDRVGAHNAQKHADSKIARGLPVGGRSGLAARIASAAAKHRQGKNPSESAPTAGSGKQATSKLLQEAWKNIIPTWGLSIIWIDIHIFLSHVLGKDLFCSLGQEWFPKGTPQNLYGAKKSVGMTEGMAVGCLNFGCLVLLLGTLTVFAMIVTGITNPMEAIKRIFGSLWCVLGSCEG